MLEIERNLQYVFQALCKAPRSADKACGTHIPDTLHYQHGSLRSWYHKDDTTGEILRRDRRECSRERIIEVFCDGVPKGRPVAMYIHLCAPPWAQKSDLNSRRTTGASGARTDPGMVNTSTTTSTGGQQRDAVGSASKHCSEFGEEAFPISVDYFDHDRLEAFLATRENKHDVLLQRFVDGGAVNDCFSTVEVCWSPYQLLTSQRMSKVSVRQVDVPLYTRCHTFDNDTLFNRSVKVVTRIRDKIQRECEAVVGHIGEVDGRSVLRLVAYFAINAQNTPVLLWAPEMQYCTIDGEERRKRLATLAQQDAMKDSLSRRLSCETSARRRSVLVREDFMMSKLRDPAVSSSSPHGAVVDGDEEVGGDSNGDGRSTPRRLPTASYTHTLRVDAAVAAQKMSFNRKRQLCLLAPPVIPSDVSLPDDWDVMLDKQRARHASPGGSKIGSKKGDEEGETKGVASRLRSLKGTPKIGRRNVGYEGVSGANCGLGVTESRGNRLADATPTEIAVVVHKSSHVDDQLNILDQTYLLSRAARNPTSYIERGRAAAAERAASRNGMGGYTSPSPHRLGSPNTKSIAEAFHSLPTAHSIQLRSPPQSRPATSCSSHGPLRDVPISIGGTSSSIVGTSTLMHPNTSAPLNPEMMAKQQNHIKLQEKRKEDRTNTSKRFYTPTPTKSKGIFAVKGLPQRRPQSSNSQIGYSHSNSLGDVVQQQQRGGTPSREVSYLGTSRTFGLSSVSGLESEDGITAPPLQHGAYPSIHTSHGGSPSPHWMKDKERVYTRGGGGGYFVRQINKSGRVGGGTERAHSRSPSNLGDTNRSVGTLDNTQRDLFATKGLYNFAAPTPTTGGPLSRQDAMDMIENIRVERGGATTPTSNAGGARTQIGGAAASPYEPNLVLFNPVASGVGIAPSSPIASVIVALRDDTDESMPITPNLLPSVLAKSTAATDEGGGAVSLTDNTTTVDWNLLLRHAVHTRQLLTAIPPPSSSNGSVNPSLSQVRGSKSIGDASGGASIFTSSPTSSSNYLKVSPADHPVVGAHCKAADEAFSNYGPTSLVEAPVLWDVAVFSQMDAITDSLQSVQCAPPPAGTPPSALDPIIIRGRANAIVTTKRKARGAGMGGDVRNQVKYQVNLLDLFNRALVEDRYLSVMAAHHEYLQALDGLSADLESAFYNAARGAEGSDFISCGNVPLSIPLLSNGRGDERDYGLLMLPAALLPSVLCALTQLLPSKSPAAFEAAKIASSYAKSVTQCTVNPTTARPTVTSILDDEDEKPLQSLGINLVPTSPDDDSQSLEALFEAQQQRGVACAQELLLGDSSDASTSTFRAACNVDGGVPTDQPHSDQVPPLVVVCEGGSNLAACLLKLRQVRTQVESSMIRSEMEFLELLIDRCDKYGQTLQRLRTTRRARYKRLEQEAQRAAALAAIQQSNGAAGSGTAKSGLDSLAVAKKRNTSVLGTSTSKSLGNIPDALPADVAEELVTPHVELFALDARFVNPNTEVELRKKSSQVIDLIAKVELKNRIQARRVTSAGRSFRRSTSQLHEAPSMLLNREGSVLSRSDDANGGSTDTVPPTHHLQVDAPHLAFGILPFVQSILRTRIEELERRVTQSETLPMFWPPPIRLYK